MMNCARILTCAALAATLSLLYAPAVALGEDGDAAPTSTSPSPSTSAPTQDSDVDTDDDEHYRLQRVAVMLQITGNPMVRIQCSIFEDTYYTSKTVVWDPSERRGMSRYLVLPYRPVGTSANRADS